MMRHAEIQKNSRWQENAFWRRLGPGEVVVPKDTLVDKNLVLH